MNPVKFFLAPNKHVNLLRFEEVGALMGFNLLNLKMQYRLLLVVGMIGMIIPMAS